MVSNQKEDCLVPCPSLPQLNFDVLLLGSGGYHFLFFADF